MRATKEQVANKLGVQTRSCGFIYLNEELCERIMNETPIRLDDYCKSIDTSYAGFVSRYLKTNKVAWFSNKPFKQGTRPFVFKEECDNLLKNTIFHKATVSHVHKKHHKSLITNLIKEKFELLYEIELLESKKKSIIGHDKSLKYLKKDMDLIKENPYVFSFCKRANISTMKQLSELTEKEMRKFRNVGNGTIDVIRQLLHENGLKLLP